MQRRSKLYKKMDELKLVMGEDGVFREYKDPYCVIECPKQADYDHIVKMVERGEKMRWIPVSDRMPEADEFVLVVVNGEYKNITFTNAIEMAEHNDEGWILETFPEWQDPTVTHWMPLPEPPEEESP